MDACESEQALQKHKIGETPRPPLVPAERNNAVGTVHTRTREVSSRYKARSTPSVTPSVPRRSPSPNLSRTVSKSSQLVQRRSQSAERKRPSTPPSPSPRLSTPVQDSSVDVQLASRRTITGRSPEGLWPSTMRSLTVSFQSDTISIPVTKKEKPLASSISDRTLRPYSNVAQKQAETPAVARKPTPERKRSPLKGKNAGDQSENSRPGDALHSRVIDQHRWPSRSSGRSNSLSRNLDLADKMSKSSSTHPGNGLSSPRRMSPNGMSKPIQRSVSDATRITAHDENFRAGLDLYNDDHPISVSRTHKLASVDSPDRMTLTSPIVRSPSLPTPGSRPPSPSKNMVLPSPVLRGFNPSRPRPSTPSRGNSPSRTRLSSASSQSSSSTSVLSFIADFKKGKRSASYLEDAHQLRLLHNGYLQWRFSNAQAETILYIQKENAEENLCDVWNSTLSLWNSVKGKRIKLQQLRLELKINSILNGQMAYLDDWVSFERDHLSSLSGAVEDLEASTLRLPVTGGARTDIETLKAAICSAVDVMQAMGSSLCSLLPKVEGMNSLVSELATVAAEERAMLDECEALLASATAMQVEEYSLRTHLVQMNKICR